MATRVRNQRGEGERLRTSLLDAAGELLAEARDVDKLSVRAVTARAGVSPTALYLHFDDKDDLIHEVKVRCFAALGAAIEACLDPGAEPRDQLLAGCRAYLRFAREHPGQYAILFHTANMPPKRRAAGRQLDGAGAAVFGILVECVGRCLDDDADAFDRATVIWTALHGRALLAVALPHFPQPDEDRLLGLLADGLVG
jgi:AcrR family transcriptional regulator